jgi:hypothetical protein
MAIMIPKTVDKAKLRPPEMEVWYRLKEGMDDSCVIFHSWDFLPKNRKGNRFQAEIDFVVIIPARGLLVMEVKGGVIKSMDREWFQNNNPIEDPFSQAQRNYHLLEEYLKDQLPRPIPIKYAYAVCFPNTDDMTVPPNADGSMIITRNKLPAIRDSIERIFDCYGRPTLFALEPDEIMDIKSVLAPNFVFGQSLVSKIDYEQSKIFALTEEQCHLLLDVLDQRRRVLIKGCAGSGKTVMALKKARELAAEGHKILLLCHNKLLGERLALSTSELSNNITAMTYIDYAISEISRAGIELDHKRNDAEYWEKVIPETFLELLLEHPIKYDAIVVDEGQDFLKSYWDTIEEMLDESSYLYIFYDDNQNIFGTQLPFPIKDVPFTLTYNCRNTRMICEEVQKYSDRQLKLREDVPDGEEVVQIKCSSDYEFRQTLAAILHELTGKQIMRERIVVLGVQHETKDTCLHGDPQVGNFAIVDAGREKVINGIAYYSYRRFKGCEADIVILLDVDPKDKRWTGKALYTAVSRAQLILYILYRQ